MTNILIKNRKARFDYSIIDQYQAGLSLSGEMVKLIRAKKLNLNSAYVVAQNNKLEIIGLQHKDLMENVGLLLNKKEKAKIITAMKTKGITCVVLNIKAVGRWLKADIATVKGKSNYDKRDTLKKRDIERRIRKESL